MKSLVLTKNKLLLSLDAKARPVSDDAEFTALTGYYHELVKQQRAVFKNVVKQEAVLKGVGLGPLCEELRKGGCGRDPVFGRYGESVKRIDKLLLDYQVLKKG